MLLFLHFKRKDKNEEKFVLCFQLPGRRSTDTQQHNSEGGKNEIDCAGIVSWCCHRRTVRFPGWSLGNWRLSKSHLLKVVSRWSCKDDDLALLAMRITFISPGIIKYSSLAYPGCKLSCDRPTSRRPLLPPSLSSTREQRSGVFICSFKPEPEGINRNACYLFISFLDFSFLLVVCACHHHHHYHSNVGRWQTPHYIGLEDRPTERLWLFRRICTNKR